MSLTLVPMLCAKLIRHRPERERTAFDLKAERVFNDIIARYGRALNWVLDRQPATLLVAILTLALTILLYVLIPKGFFPVQDTGMIQAITQASQSVSYGEMAELQNKLAEAILKDPNVVNVSSFVGVDGTNQTLNTGRFLITLKPHDDRNLSASDIIRRLQNEVSGVIGITLYMQPVQDLTINTTISRAPYHFVLEDANSAEFDTWVPNLVQRLSQLPQITDVASDLQQQGLAVDIVIDRATASRFGITPATIDNALYDAFGQRIVSTIYTQSNQYRVILELAPTLQQSLTELEIALFAVIVVIEQRPGPPDRYRACQSACLATIDYAFRAISGDDDLVQHRTRLFARFRHHRHPTDGGPSRAAIEFHHRVSRHRGGIRVFLGQRSIPDHRRGGGDVYRAWRPLRELHPSDRRILSTLPSAGVGALLSLMLLRYDLDVIAIIGIILLIGIVKKNAIMMIDFALEAERVEGLPPRDAIYQACLLRFRPIMMTTMAAILGALPLMLGTGTGSELRQPLGIAIIGGLVVSQMLTLFTTPVIYLYFDRLAAGLTGRGAASPIVPTQAE